jgi:hypothetical protein
MPNKLYDEVIKERKRKYYHKRTELVLDFYLVSSRSRGRDKSN